MAEQSALAARNGERRRLRRDGQITRCHQLTAGGSGQGVHPGDDGLGDVLHGVHHARAGVEEMMSDVGRRTGHVGEVVTRAEHRSVGGDDQTVGIGRRHRLQGFDDFEHGVERQGVALLRTIQREGEDGALARQFDVVVTHGGSLARVVGRRHPPPALAGCTLRR